MPSFLMMVLISNSIIISVKYINRLTNTIGLILVATHWYLSWYRLLMETLFMQLSIRIQFDDRLSLLLL